VDGLHVAARTAVRAMAAASAASGLANAVRAHDAARAEAEADLGSGTRAGPAAWGVDSPAVPGMDVGEEGPAAVVVAATPAAAPVPGAGAPPLAVSLSSARSARAGGWSPWEDALLLRLVREYGTHWDFLSLVLRHHPLARVYSAAALAPSGAAGAGAGAGAGASASAAAGAAGGAPRAARRSSVELYDRHRQLVFWALNRMETRETHYASKRARTIASLTGSAHDGAPSLAEREDDVAAWPMPASQPAEAAEADVTEGVAAEDVAGLAAGTVTARMRQLDAAVLRAAREYKPVPPVFPPELVPLPAPHASLLTALSAAPLAQHLAPLHGRGTGAGAGGAALSASPSALATALASTFGEAVQRAYDITVPAFRKMAPFVQQQSTLRARSQRMRQAADGGAAGALPDGGGGGAITPAAAGVSGLADAGGAKRPREGDGAGDGGGDDAWATAGRPRKVARPDGAGRAGGAEGAMDPNFAAMVSSLPPEVTAQIQPILASGMSDEDKVAAITQILRGHQSSAV
jgi:hypothetical protein